MTNGAGGPHAHKRTQKAAGKKLKQRDPKVSVKQKGWVPAALAKSKGD